MKIVHVHDVAFVGSTLVSGLREIGMDAELYSFANYNNPRLPKIFQSFITAVLRFTEIFRLGKHLRKGKYNIVHIHFGTFAYLALLNRVPFFLHIHGTDIRRFVNSPILGAIIQLGLKKAKAVFYTTPDLKPLIDKYRPDAIFFPNPVDTNKFLPNSEYKNQDDLVVFNINKLDRYKGLDKVLPALDQILTNNPDVRILMFDFGNAKQDAQNFISKYQNDPRLITMHPVSHEKMLELIQGSSVIVGQMATGSLGCSELEAMSCAKPVVCNFVYEFEYPSIPPIFNATTAEEIIDHINYILSNPDKAQITGKEARKWVVNNFDKHIIAQKLVQIYQENGG